MQNEPSEFDPNDMHREIYAFVDNLSEAVEGDLDIKADFDRIVICGMGGSAIGGDVIADSLYPTMNFPITVQRFPALPRWVNGSTLVIVSSHSGNTKETLSMYDQAVQRGSTVVVITSGGKLLEKARGDGKCIVEIPAGIQPRSALGHILGSMANIIETVGGPRCKTDIKKLIPKLLKFRSKLESDRSVARTAAKDIFGKAPVIYSTSGIPSAAIRWKTQINENSKMMAFAGSIPEFNHNEVAGWSEGGARNRCILVFLYEENANRTVRKLSDAAIKAVVSYGIRPKVIKIRGRTILERCLRACMFGDYVSLYLAYLRGVDPSEVKTIKDFKLRLEEPTRRKQGIKSWKSKKDKANKEED